MRRILSQLRRMMRETGLSGKAKDGRPRRRRKRPLTANRRRKRGPRRRCSPSTRRSSAAAAAIREAVALKPKGHAFGSSEARAPRGGARSISVTGG